MRVKQSQKPRYRRGNLKDAAAALAAGDGAAFLLKINANARNRQKWARQKRGL